MQWRAQQDSNLQPIAYKKLGYNLDYEQKGYTHNLSKIFLSKDLKS